jgi:hypothetical protein
VGSIFLPLVSITRFMNFNISLIITIISLGRPIPKIPTSRAAEKLIFYIFFRALRSPEQLSNILGYIINIDVWTIELFLRLLRTANWLAREFYGAVLFWVY